MSVVVFDHGLPVWNNYTQMHNAQADITCNTKSLAGAEMLSLLCSDFPWQHHDTRPSFTLLSSKKIFSSPTFCSV
jgi:hypothetical protein